MFQLEIIPQDEYLVIHLPGDALELTARDAGFEIGIHSFGLNFFYLLIPKSLPRSKKQRFLTSLKEAKHIAA